MVRLVPILILVLTSAASGEDLGLKPSVYPVLSSTVTSAFGMRRHPIRKMVRHHNGIDIASSVGAKVRSVETGVVIFAGNYGGLGQLVTVRHEDGLATLYGHLSQAAVEVGDSVEAGDVLGAVGKSGEATGPHLHFEVRLEGQAIDPEQLLPAIGEKAVG